ncbi:MAG: Holliday junction branch migration protein RuvA [Agathobacter sp.]|nr:Holliday junction branch migration protein RuvA [Agathobacter sp.]
MYAYIKGILAEVNTDSIVIENQGIGYQLYVSLQALEELPAIGMEVKVYTYLHVREDAMVLFGFPDREDLKMFQMLLTVSGVGPKGALGILSALSGDDLRFAILSGDSKAISKAPGIGAKTAQRVILELKDKVSLEDAFETKTAHIAGGNVMVNGTVKNEAIQALVALGYSSSEAMKAVSQVEISQEHKVEDVLKLALKHMAF